MGSKILITVLSTFSSEGKETPYYMENGEIIYASWTNEAGLLCLLKGNERITKIIALCSKQTYNDQYREQLERIIRENTTGVVPEIKMICYDISDSTGVIAEKLINNSEFESDDVVYIDTTGGPRNVSYFLVFLFRYFAYIGIKIEKAIYSSKPKDKDGTISEITNDFRMFDLINGVHDFISTGNPSALCRYFDGTEDSKLKELLDEMTTFYDRISICRMQNIEITMDHLGKCIAAFKEESTSTDAEGISGDIDRMLLKTLLPKIENKFFGSDIPILSLIKWCVDNGLIQQAITIYFEKLPEMFFRSREEGGFGFLSIDNERMKNLSVGQGKNKYTQYLLTLEDLYQKLYWEEVQYLVGVKYNPKIKNCMINNWKKRLYDNLEKELFSEERIISAAAVIMICDILRSYYDNNGKRMEKAVPGTDIKIKKLMSEVISPVSSNMPKTAEGFLKDLCSKNFQSFIRFIQNSDEFKTKHRAERKEKDIIKKSIDNQALEILSNDLLYVRYVRNQINHASDVTEDKENSKERLLKADKERYIIPDDNVFNVSILQRFLRESIGFIETLISKPEND